MTICVQKGLGRGHRRIRAAAPRLCHIADAPARKTLRSGFRRMITSDSLQTSRRLGKASSVSVFQMFVNLPQVSQLEVLVIGLGLGIRSSQFFLLSDVLGILYTFNYGLLEERRVASTKSGFVTVFYYVHLVGRWTSEDSHQYSQLLWNPGPDRHCL